jgi:hypothetical protein
VYRLWFCPRKTRAAARRIEEVLARTGGKYLDASAWAEIRDISESEAQQQLNEGVAKGFFDRCLLYTGSEFSPFVVPLDWDVDQSKFREVFITAE